MNRKKIAIIVVVIILIIILGCLSYYFFQLKSQSKGITHGPCLANNEFADYYPRLPIALKPVTISVKDKNTNQEKFSFQIKNVLETYFTVQSRKCGVYAIRLFNYDPKKTKQDPGYREEIWKYTYDGKGESIILLSKKLEEFKLYYSSDFQIDPLERYATLIKGYLGSSDYAVVIKSLKTFEDIFVLSMTEIEKQNAEIMGNISFEDWWSDDGRYFWGRTHIGANTLGFFRINTTNWNAEIFPAPKDVLGGDALNVENGYITVHPGNVWFGIVEFTEEEKAKRRAQGIGTELYIENLITGNRYFVDKTDEPLWYFQPKWLSDTELEYELPSGEKKIYKIEEE